MAKRILMICVASAIALVVSVPSAIAAPTLVQGDIPVEGPEGLMNSTETSTVEANSWITIQYIGSAPGMDVYTFGDGDFGWTHTFDPTDKFIYEAELTIMAWDVDFADGERDEVYADGQSLGFLSGSADSWSQTDFPIDKAMLADGQLDVWLDIDATNGYWATTIDYSQLMVHWDWLADIEPGKPDVIPAPGAILLGGIGVGVVNWLRRRRTL